MNRNARITVRIPEKRKQLLIQWAKDNNCTISDVINNLIDNQFHKENRHKRYIKKRKVNKMNDTNNSYIDVKLRNCDNAIGKKISIDLTLDVDLTSVINENLTEKELSQAITEIVKDKVEEKISSEYKTHKKTTKQQDLPHCEGGKTQSLCIINNKLANNINTVMAKGFEGMNINVADKKSKKAIYTACIIALNDKNVKLSSQISNYEMSIYNAIATYTMHYGIEKPITLENIYRIMVGDNGYTTPSRQQIKQIKQFIDKMRVHLTRIDCTNEVKAYKKTHLASQYDGLHISGTNERFYYDTYLLAASWVTAVSGRNEVTALKLFEKPVLLSYAEISGQILNIPSYLLDTKRILSNTSKNLIIRDCLLRRIATMKGTNNMKQQNIRLHSYTKNGKHKLGLYEQVTQNPRIDTKESDLIRKSVVKYLDYWKDCKYITGYEFLKDGRTISSIKIML